MTRERSECPSDPRIEISKLSLTIRGSVTYPSAVKSGLFLIAAFLVLVATGLSIVDSPLASTVSYAGVGIGLLANAIPKYLSGTILVNLSIQWEPELKIDVNVDIRLSNS